MFSNPNVFYIWDQIGALVSLWPTRQFLFNNHTRVQMGTVLRGKYENSYRTQMRRHCGAVLSCVSSEDSVGDTTVVVPRSHAWHRQQTISSSTRSSTAVPSYLVLTGPRDKVKIITSTRKKNNRKTTYADFALTKRKSYIRVWVALRVAHWPWLASSVDTAADYKTKVQRACYSYNKQAIIQRCYPAAHQ